MTMVRSAEELLDTLKQMTVQELNDFTELFDEVINGRTGDDGGQEG